MSLGRWHACPINEVEFSVQQPFALAQVHGRTTNYWRTDGLTCTSGIEGSVVDWADIEVKPAAEWLAGITHLVVQSASLINQINKDFSTHVTATAQNTLLLLMLFGTDKWNRRRRMACSMVAAHCGVLVEFVAAKCTVSELDAAFLRQVRAVPKKESMVEKLHSSHSAATREAIDLLTSTQAGQMTGDICRVVCRVLLNDFVCRVEGDFSQNARDRG